MGDTPRPGAARAFWIARPGAGEIRPMPRPSAGPGEVLVRATRGAISKGTETLVFRGEVPPGVAARMRCPFQEGAFPAPVKYGYATVGTAVEGPAERLGQAVFCLHPHQDLFAVPAGAARPLPAGVPPGRAVLAAAMETALNALWDARPRRGSRVCAIGAGAIGLSVAYLARRLAGARVEVFDIDPAREAPARALGLGFALRPPEGAEWPLVLHASGAPEGLRTALRAAAFEGRVLELSWYGTRPVTLPLGEDFHDRRLTIQSSQVATVAPSRRARWSHARRLDRALALLRDPRLDALIDGESRFEDLPETMAALAAGRLPALCHRVVYD